MLISSNSAGAAKERRRPAHTIPTMTLAELYYPIHVINCGLLDFVRRSNNVGLSCHNGILRRYMIKYFQYRALFGLHDLTFWRKSGESKTVEIQKSEKRDGQRLLKSAQSWKTNV